MVIPFPVGIYYSNQSTSEPPAYSVSRDAARALKREGKAFFVDHGRNMRLLEAQKLDESKVAATMREAWQTRQSGYAGPLVLQLVSQACTSPV